MIPEVSVIMPTFNSERYIAEAIESIVCETDVSCELIVVDDGSTDNSAQIADKLAKHDSRLQVVRCAHLGNPSASNGGVKRARGEFLTRMDSDDVNHRGRLRQQVDYLRANASCVAVGSGILLLSPDGTTVPAPLPRSRTSMESPTPTDAFMPSSTAMMRTFDVRLMGGYRLAFALAGDKDLWLRLLSRGSIDNLQHYWLTYRLQENQVSTKHRALQVLNAEVAVALFWERIATGEPPWDADHPISSETVEELVSQVSPRSRLILESALSIFIQSKKPINTVDM